MLKQEILISSDLQNTSTGSVEIEEISQISRLFGAAKYLLIFSIIATASIIVPLLHFILPPFFLCIGLIVATKKYANKMLIVRGQGSCPECGQLIEIFKRPYTESFLDVCENCRRELSIKLDNMSLMK